MPCDVCTHTLQSVGIVDGKGVLWCPCCGALTTETIAHRSTEAPVLVRRVQEAAESFADGTVPPLWWRAVCAAAGVGESK